MPDATMIATLGGQPQVVTFALDELIKREAVTGEKISEVIVLCLSPRDERLQRSHDTLKAELNYYQPYVDRELKVRFEPVRVHGRPIVDVRNRQAVNDVSQFINNLIFQQKANNRVLHVCVSGGRRFLSLLTINIATLNFQHLDKLWHMYTSDQYQKLARHGQLMHLPQGYTPNDFHLMEVPVLPLGQYFPSSQTITVSERRFEIDQQEHKRCQEVIRQLTGRQVDTLREFSKGLSREEVARELTIAVSTVDQYKTTVYDVCRLVWNYPDKKSLNTSFLVTKFSNYPFELH